MSARRELRLQLQTRAWAHLKKPRFDRRPMTHLIPLAVALGAVAGGAFAAQEPGPNFRPIVMMVGCVNADDRGGFVLTNATEPEALQDRLPEEPDETAALGDGSVRLIGTIDEFGVGAHAGHKVRVRGLYIEGESENRLNLTSILHLSPSCR